MSIGLDDVGKRHGQKKAAPLPQHEAPSRVARRNSAAMNDDGSEYTASPLFWMDPDESTWLGRLNTNFASLEAKITETALHPIRSVRKLLRR